MSKLVVEFAEEEKALLIKHLEGMSALYWGINGTGDGPLTRLIEEIKRAQLVIEFDFYQLDKLLLHLKGANNYEKVVHGSDLLLPILEKLKRALHGGLSITKK